VEPIVYGTSGPFYRRPAFVRAGALGAAAVVGALLFSVASGGGSPAIPIEPVAGGAAPIAVLASPTPIPSPTYAPTEDVPDPEVDGYTTPVVPNDYTETGAPKAGRAGPAGGLEDAESCKKANELAGVALSSNMYDGEEALTNAAAHQSLGSAFEKLADRHLGSKKLGTALRKNASTEFALASAIRSGNSLQDKLRASSDATGLLLDACKFAEDDALDAALDDVFDDGLMS
jgi:hypothetical protein